MELKKRVKGNEPRESPTWKVVAADQARRSEAKSQPVESPTEWLVAETHRNRIDVIIITTIAFTAHPGLNPSISFVFSLKHNKKDVY